MAALLTPSGVDREPIRLPGSPFWNVFKTFGRDELIALIVSTIGTTAMSFATSSVLILAIAGPVVEKIGLYAWYVYEACALYRATAREERRSLWYYIKTALGGGSATLSWDILVHDPAYMGLFLAGTLLYPATPVWLMATAAFIAAVVVVAWLQVVWTEAQYALFKRRMLAAGFAVDTYLEARFYIRWNYTPEVAIAKLREGLCLHEVERIRYWDVYLKSDLPRFSGRAPVVRLRKRTFGKSSARWRDKERMVAIGFAQTAQVVYTRPQEEDPGQREQFNFFSVVKDKFFWPLDEEVMPERAEDIKDSRVRQLLRAKEEWKRVSFERTIMLDETDMLYVAVDALPTGDGCVIELKVRKERELFLAAMRHVMRELPVTHTTRQKIELEMF